MKDLIAFSKIIALLSFVIGTTALSLYLFFNKPNAITSFGFYFVVTAFIINTILLAVNIVAIIIDREYRIGLLKTFAIMLLNIPIAIIYLYIVISIEFPAKG